MQHPLCVREQSAVDTIIKHYKQQLVYTPVLAPGAVALTTNNWFEVFTKLMGSLWTVFQGKGTPAEVKAAITESALAFYRQSLEPVFQSKLGFLYSFVRPAIEGVITEAVNGIVDGLLKIVSGPTTPATPVTPPTSGSTTTSGGFTPY